MLRTNTTRLAVLALGLAASPAFAQTRPGTNTVIVAPPAAVVSPAPMAVQGPPGVVTPIAPVAPVVGPMSPGVAAAPAAPGVRGNSPLNGGDRTAAVADIASTHNIDQLLQQAEQSVRQGNLALANELVERAEAQALTRSTIAGTETIPTRAGPVARMAEARAAIARRDTSTAAMLIAEAASLVRAQGL
ncbi:hypothetical protein [Roseomonas sp. CECT 9278]|uniref:hypothetical protein n=1 Tax=Roseomonas sp. CECT 9278 TaxID=2845823 RepID=UPI001E52996F|nr:hypothetical protein [Roseomonas sp. CECT 9278]CAH0298076.1 hypothetical protein ROS9278_04450 [Roseomonas sp. CECT 9278]